MFLPHYHSHAYKNPSLKTCNPDKKSTNKNTFVNSCQSRNHGCRTCSSTPPPLVWNIHKKKGRLKTENPFSDDLLKSFGIIRRYFVPLLQFRWLHRLVRLLLPQFSLPVWPLGARLVLPKPAGQTDAVERWLVLPR